MAEIVDAEHSGIEHAGQSASHGVGTPPRKAEWPKLILGCPLCVLHFFCPLGVSVGRLFGHFLLG